LLHESKSSHTRPLINNIFKCRLEELQKQDSARYRKDDDNLSAEAVESKAVNQDLTELTQKLDRLLGRCCMNQNQVTLAPLSTTFTKSEPNLAYPT
jgi:hypothetical protein